MLKIWLELFLVRADAKEASAPQEKPRPVWRLSQAETRRALRQKQNVTPPLPFPKAKPRLRVREAEAPV